jgi:predicted  nucleic acid-binding Zn-ribbon protein
MSDSWLYVCIQCGHRVTNGVDFAQSCPNCHGNRWLCHWLDKPDFVPNRDSGKDSVGDKGMTLSNTPKGCNKSQGGIISRVEGFVTRSYLAKQANQGKTRPTGRPHADISVEKVREMAGQGMTLRAIGKELGVSHTTIGRILAGQKALL